MIIFGFGILNKVFKIECSAFVPRSLFFDNPTTKFGTACNFQNSKKIRGDGAVGLSTRCENAKVLLNMGDQFINVVIELREIDCVRVEKCTTNCLVVILDGMVRDHFPSERSHSVMSVDGKSQLRFEFFVN